ncbi:MAG: DUF1385 domain-containing protein [Rubrobacteridae bacterium]|nr:DUF1385 domain-containing protein [Rubrobacteridae bacterium]
MNKLKVGGQAFNNGVLMRSKNYWALAKEDGSIEYGQIESWLERHPRFNVFLVRSLITFIEMIGFSFKNFEKNTGAIGNRFVLWLCFYVALALSSSMLVRHFVGDSIQVNSMMQFFYVGIALFTVNKGMSGQVWQYHGAEHKVVNAYESGLELDNIDSIQRCSRIHQRCGTNLMFLGLIILSLLIPVSSYAMNSSLETGIINAVLYGLYMILAMAMSLELFRQLMRWPQHFITKTFLLGGNTLQRFATTKEPAEEHLKVASRALLIVVALESGYAMKEIV